MIPRSVSGRRGKLKTMAVSRLTVAEWRNRSRGKVAKKPQIICSQMHELLLRSTFEDW